MAMSMRERIARVVYPFIVDGTDYSEVEFDMAMRRPRYQWLKTQVECAADAVLAELETPTDGMVMAIGDEAQEYAIVDSNAPLALYAAAIHAAREGK